MSKRIKPRHHLLGTAAWTLAALAGLWPAIPGVGAIGLGQEMSFLKLVALSDGWLGAVVVVGLGGLLAALLHLLAAFDLWVDGRALRRGSLHSNWRATRLGITVSVLVATLFGGGWTAYTQLRVDRLGNYTSLIDSYTSHGDEAWRRLAKAYDQARPSERLHVPAPGDDPMPTLRELAKSPVVEAAYYISPAGGFTMLAGRHTTRLDLVTWVKPADEPLWPRSGPRVRSGHADPLRHWAADIVEQRPWKHALTYREGSHFWLTYARGSTTPVLVKGAWGKGFIGYQMSYRFFEHQGAAILDALGLPARWEFSTGDEGDYTLRRPEHLDAFDLRPVHLVLQSWAGEAGSEGHLQNTLALLAALALLFVASVVEGVRQLRAMIAERAMQMAQSSFVSGVSHEMRTPLATVRLYAELLEQGLDATPVQRGEFVQAILVEVDRLHRLIENVLDFARISGRKRSYAFVPTELRGVIDEALQAARGPLTTAGMSCEVHMPAPVSASVDRDAIVQALANLLSNAAKYGAAGGRVWISAMPASGGVDLAVQDFGPGVPRHEQVKIFHPFYRIAGQAVGGTGLGLALVMEYARAHSGHVSLVSPPGEGATFTLHLPDDPTRAVVVPSRHRRFAWKGALAALTTGRPS